MSRSRFGTISMSRRAVGPSSPAIAVNTPLPGRAQRARRTSKEGGGERKSSPPFSSSFLRAKSCELTSSAWPRSPAPRPRPVPAPPLLRLWVSMPRPYPSACASAKVGAMHLPSAPPVSLRPPSARPPSARPPSARAPSARPQPRPFALVSPRSQQWAAPGLPSASPVPARACSCAGLPSSRPSPLLAPPHCLGAPGSQLGAMQRGHGRRGHGQRARII